MRMVKCRICSKVVGRDKLLVPKLDYLITHSKMQKCIVVIGQYSICSTNSHVKNEKLFVAKGLDTVVAQLENVCKAKSKKNTSNLWQFGIFSNKAIPRQILKD